MSLLDLTPSHVYTLLFILAVYFLLHQLFLRPLFFSPLRNAPGPPLGHPLYGQFRNIVRAEAGTLQMAWAEKYGPVVRAVGPFGVERMMFLSPGALQRILVSEWVDYPRPDFLRNVLGISAGYGLLTVTGNTHKQMRRAMNPAFSLANLVAQTDMYYPPIEGLVNILHKKISADPDTPIPMYEWMSKLTLDIICATAFGYNADSLHDPSNELAQAYHELIELQSGPNIARFIALMTLPGLPRFFRTDFAYRYRARIFRGRFLAPTQSLLSAMHRIKAVARTMLAQKLAEVDVKDASSKRDIMSLLVRARMNDTDEGYKMSDQDLVEQVLTFLGAGHETTASGLSWTLLLLARAPAAQARLRAEVAPLVQAAGGRPEWRTLKEGAWLDCVVMESLRLLPPVPMTVRKAGKSDWVEGVYLPKGTLLYIPIRVVNTWTKIWGEDAKEFNPARWLNLPPTYNPTFSLLSFIAGPHACIGRTMAIMEMKAILAVLISHFEFSLAEEGQVARPTAAVTMKPEDGLPLRVKAVPGMGPV